MTVTSNSRERNVTTLSHREPDRVPISFGGLHDSIHLYGHRIFSGKSLKKIEDHVFPDPAHPSRFEGLRKRVRRMYDETD
jgi:hypothetical protein